MNYKTLMLLPAIALAAPASAAVVSYTDSFTGSTDFASKGSSDPGFVTEEELADDLMLSKYDGSLGELESVTVELQISFDSVGTFENKNPERGIGANWQMTLNSLFESEVFENQSVSAQDSRDDIFIESGETLDIVLSATKKFTFTPEQFDWFISGGADDEAFAVAFNGAASTSFNFEGGNGDLTVVTDGTVRATVTYETAMAPVPVPASVPLLLTALGGLGFVARRKRAA